MHARTTNHLIDAESVWGIEAMNPLEQRAWAQSLWQRLSGPQSACRPALLLYSPAAERAVLRALTALGIISHEQRFAVHRFASRDAGLPVLPAVTITRPSTLLVHHANRFVNLGEWLKINSPSPECRVVLTAPRAEYELFPGAAEFDCARVPEEEPDYCERKAREIVEKFFYGAMPAGPELKSSEPILIEAGMAEVRLPLALLARHAGLENEVLIKKLRASRLRQFIWWPEASAATPRTVAFRGRWLAERLGAAEKTAATPAHPFPHLIALLNKADSTLPEERYFFLNLLAALRSHGYFTLAERLLRDYYERFHGAESLAGPQERKAWGFFHPQHLQTIFHF